MLLSLRQVKKHNRYKFSVFFNMKVFCVFSLESPYLGNSNENTQCTSFSLKIIIQFILNLQPGEFFLGTQE